MPTHFDPQALGAGTDLSSACAHLPASPPHPPPNKPPEQASHQQLPSASLGPGFDPVMAPQPPRQAAWGQSSQAELSWQQALTLRQELLTILARDPPGPPSSHQQLPSASLAPRPYSEGLGPLSGFETLGRVDVMPQVRHSLEDQA